jgi:hypothetical protein
MVRQPGWVKTRIAIWARVGGTGIEVGRRGVKNRQEYPLVILDHEALLQYQRVEIIKECDDSFLSFMLHNGAEREGASSWNA